MDKLGTISGLLADNMKNRESTEGGQEMMGLPPCSPKLKMKGLQETGILGEPARR